MFNNIINRLILLYETVNAVYECKNGGFHVNVIIVP